ncbi:MAG: hypothetical protein J6I40_01025 [Mailhella sp.]|nr:hypothetical protein [Mailhella sp.]
MNASHFYCLFFAIIHAIVVITLGYFVYKGASHWIIVAMVLMALSYVIPGKEKFTCPKCGYTASVKTFTGSQLFLEAKAVQNEEDEE